MIRTCDSSDVYILLKGTITVTGVEADTATRLADKRDKQVTLKNCASFTDCISEVNNTQVDNAEDLDVVLPIYNLIKYSDNYAKTSESLWQYYKDDSNNNTTDSESFKFKERITG